MNTPAGRRLARLYAAALQLYPAAVRSEYGAEMQAVFALHMQAAARRGGLALLLAALRELRDLPFAAAAARWSAFGGSMSTVYPTTSDQTPWAAALLSLLPFVLAGPVRVALVFVSNYGIPSRQTALAEYYLPYLALTSALLLAGFVLGALLRFPRWSYPYAIGLFYALTSAYSTAAWVFGWKPAGPLFYQLIAGMLLLLCLPGLRRFYHNIRHDWTLLSYGIYGLVLLLLATFDRDETPVLTAQVLLPSVIGLAAALAHLRIRQARARLLVLVAAALAGVLVLLLPVLDGMHESIFGVLIWLVLVLGFGGVLAGLLLSPLLVVSALQRGRSAGPSNPAP